LRAGPDRKNLCENVTPSSLRIDDIHLTEHGYRIVADAVFKTLQKHNW